MYAQVLDDSQRHAEASDALATPGGAELKKYTKAPLTIKTVAPLVPRSGYSPRLTRPLVSKTQERLTLYTYPCTVAPMKRRDLERTLRQLGWYFLRHGGKHDVWTNGTREEAIPRHSEINEKLAQALLRGVNGST